MTTTAAPARASFSELRHLTLTHPAIHAWVELRRQLICWQDWDIIPATGAAQASSEAIRFFRHPDPDWRTLRDWLGTLTVDLVTLDAAVVVLVKPHGAGGGLFGSDIQGLRLADPAITEPAIDSYGVLKEYVLYTGEVPRRDFTAMFGEPLSMNVLARYPADRCLYLSMNPRRESPFGMSPLEKAIERREDGTIDADATAENLPEADDPAWARDTQAFLKAALFDAILGRCSDGSLAWKWET